MKIKIHSICIAIFLAFSCTAAQAQATKASKENSYWVFFKDKCSSLDYFQAPLCESYLEELTRLNIHAQWQSKWLNAVSVSESDLPKLKNLHFVSGIQPCGKYKTIEFKANEEFAYGNGDWQIQLIGLDSLHRKGFTGKGVRLAVFDGGFYNLDSIPAFDSLWINQQIIASRDFVLNDSLRYNQSAHGMQVMSLLASQYKDSLVGASPHAHYVLARTEQTGSETHSEEFNWLRAMEWADSIGVDIIHSSLGYSLFDSLEGDYTYADMDGESTIITLAAELAASRGIFITNSAGNSGNDPWKYITAPCDGKHVLCVGAVDSFRVKGGFSSFGPSADGRVKPDVMAMGVRNTVFTPNGLLRTGSGTSFSGPIIAGAVACLMQAHPNHSNEAIYQAVIQSCDRYLNPDSAYGYGIPDMVKADSLLNSFVNIREYTEIECKLYPNPAQNNLKVICDPGAEFSIYDIHSRIVLEGVLFNWYNLLDISELSSGTYIIQLRTKVGQINKRIIIN